MTKPRRRINAGGVSASIWDSTKGYSFSLQKSYKVNEEVKYSSNFFPSDLGNILQVVMKLNIALEGLEKEGKPETASLSLDTGEFNLTMDDVPF